MNKQIYMYVLGAIVVVGIIALVSLLIFVEAPQGNKDVLLIVVGAFTAKFSDVVSYFYGSSKGSEEKTRLLTGAKNDKS